MTPSLTPDLSSVVMPTAAEIYTAEPNRRRECLYYLALGYYKLGSWENAKKFNGPSPHLTCFLLDLS